MGEALMVRRGGAGGAALKPVIENLEFVRNGDKELRVFIPYSDLPVGNYFARFTWVDAKGNYYTLIKGFSRTSSTIANISGTNVYLNGSSYVLASDGVFTYDAIQESSVASYQSSTGVMRFTYTFPDTVAETSITVLEAQLFKLGE